MLIRSIFVFIAVYVLFSISGLLFPVDREWYDALNKPAFTPPGGTIGIIWAVLFALIALAAAIIYYKKNFSKESKTFWLIFAVNYISNQLFSYFQFSQKNLLAASIDCLIVAVTALLLILSARKISRAAALLLIPYFLWTAFATYLSFSIYSMNL